VIKARYYPHGNILDTVFSSDPSPVWKGVEFGLELLKEGMISRIGNGRNTHITRDHWIPGDVGFRITALKKNTRLRWINQLIDRNSNTWNTPLLRELFFEHDVQAILGIELPLQNLEDRLAWQPERNGIFTVKSAYWLALSLKHQQRDVGSTSSKTDGERSLWNCIWKTDVPPKVRIFGWRLATDSLPTRKNKFRRTLEPDDTCTICGSAVEDAHHATVRCSKAAGLRQAMRDHWALPKENSFNFTGKDWLLVCLNQVGKAARAKILLLLWRAWHLRNDIIHQQGKESVANSVAFLLAYNSGHPAVPQAGNLDKGKRPVQDDSLQAAQALVLSVKHRWRPPSPGWIKLNTDASFIGNGRPSAAGAVARNHKGDVVLAACSPLISCLDAEDAEAKAALMGIKLLTDRGIDKIIIEGDYALVTNALRSEAVDRSKLWAKYEEARSLLADFQEHRVEKINRESNRVADTLAKMGRSAGSCLWLDQFPDCIHDLVTQDKNLSASMLI
jgi:ribonuclease HI